MAGIILEGSQMRSPIDFFVQFFGGADPPLPDYGGRTLDALRSALMELHEPLTVMWRESGRARETLGAEWFDECVRILTNGGHRQPVQVHLQ
jgi:RNAse (barnase) inhibitor barstar